MKAFRISGDAAEVDHATNVSISRKYPIEDEIKLLRRALVAVAKGEALPEEFVAYHDFVERVVDKRRQVKRLAKEDA